MRAIYNRDDALMSLFCLSCWSQITCLFISACSSALCFYRWLRLKAEHKKQVWKLLSWFSALTFAASVLGIAGWSFWLRNTLQTFLFGKPGYRLSDGEFYLTYSSFHFGMAVRFVVYGLEVFCCCLAMLTPLHRLVGHVVHGMQKELDASNLMGRWYVKLEHLYLKQVVGLTL